MRASEHVRRPQASLSRFFFFNDTATTEIYTLSLHDALPISVWVTPVAAAGWSRLVLTTAKLKRPGHPHPAANASRDRKSTRLNSSHANISYAVFCLKKKKGRIDAYSLARFFSMTCKGYRLHH